MSRPPILVLGTEDLGSGVEAYAWDTLPLPPLNASGFKTVIMNYVPFKEDETLVGRVRSDSVPDPVGLRDLLRSKEKTKICIGNPRQVIDDRKIDLNAGSDLRNILIQRHKIAE